jgi:TRAP-type C4-dicarboxylate transport system permease small subunit
LDRLSEAYGKLLDVLALVACALLAGMGALICIDVLLRNAPLPGGPWALDWATEISETTLYLIAMLSAPWLMRHGLHVRVDIVLRAIPPRAAWLCEWFSDAVAFACCACMMAYGTVAAWESYSQNSIVIKTLVTPEWWTHIVLPVAFLLLSVEVLFRMRRLALGPRQSRADAVSSS